MSEAPAIQTYPGSETGDWQTVGVTEESAEQSTDYSGVRPSDDTEQATPHESTQEGSEAAGGTAGGRRSATPATYRPCRCSWYTTEDGVGTGGCDKNVTSRRNFAPGHDAKLKSLLIAAGKRQTDVVELNPSTTEQLTRTPVETARLFGFGDMVAEGIQRQPAKRTRKPAVTVAQEAEMTPVVASRMAYVKVGRWTYEAEIRPDGLAIYTTKAGEAKEANFGDYTEVEGNDSPEHGDDF